ncbi:MAG: hypothetical protein ACR2QZ_07805, partial [Woeseiaceae bacterium]
MNSRLANWLQIPFRRRFCAALFVAAALGLLAFLVSVDWSSVYFSDSGDFRIPPLWFVLTFLAVVIVVFIADHLLFMAIRPVLSFEDEAYDERQEALVTKANGKARYSGLIFLAALTVAGAAQVHPVTIFFLGCLFMG